MRFNRAFPLEVSCLAVGNGKELGVGLAPHCDLGKIGNPAVLIAANVLKGIKARTFLPGYFGAIG